MDVFHSSTSLWFSMEPVYNAPILDIYIQSLITWGSPHPDNGIILIKILAQIALCCHILEKDIGFNHRDLKPDNILIKTDRIQKHVLQWKNEFELTIASSPTAILVDFGFSCLGPGTQPWIQSGDGILPPFDACPKVGRDVFMLLVFLLWRRDVRASLSKSHLEFFKSSLHLTTGKLSQMMNMDRDPAGWIYMLITERGFQCPALNPLIWLRSCAENFPEIVQISPL
jgi:serine/threonine protein kinase